MSIRTLNHVSEDEKHKILNNFLQAHEDQLFSQEVVALYLQCSPWTLAKMRSEDSKLPFAKIGSRIAYKKRDVMNYLALKTVTNTAQYSKNNI